MKQQSNRESIRRAILVSQWLAAAGMMLLSGVIAVDAADTLPPTVSIGVPAAGSAISAAGFTFSGTASDSGTIAKVRIYIYDEARSRFTVVDSNAAFTSTSGSWNFSVLAAHISAGAVAHLWVQAQDSAGNVSPWQERPVQISGSGSGESRDILAPIAVIATPVNNSAISTAGVSFTGTASDDTGVSKVRIYIFDHIRKRYTVTNALANFSTSTGAWSFQILSAHVTAGGSAQLWAQAEDAAGNRSPWQSAYVTVQRGVAGLGFSRVRFVSGQVLIEKRLNDGTLNAAKPMILRGVGYSPVDLGESVGTLADARQHLRESRYAEDFALMQQLGANAVKTYADAGIDQAAIAILDEAYSRGLMVAVTLDIDSTLVQQVVEAYKNHPALLCWIIGNEWNLNGFFRGLTASQGAASVNQIAQQVHSADPNHPVVSSLGFMPSDFNKGPDITNSVFKSIVDSTPNVDGWALNVYRSESFDPIFLEWSLISAKPFFFGEFGTDSVNAAIGNTDDWMQSNALFNQWDEIHRQTSINRPTRQCLGGFVFEWNDEWWKMGNPSALDSTGYANERTILHSQTGAPLAVFRGHPDGTANEEHFGIVTLARQAKEAFWVLSEAFKLGTLRTEPMAVNIRSAGGGNLGYVAFSKRGLPMYASEFPGIHLMTISRDTGSIASIRRFGVASNPQAECNALQAAVAAIRTGDIAALAIGQNTLPAGTTFASSALSGCVAAFNQLGAQLALMVGQQQAWALIAVAGPVPQNLSERSGLSTEVVDITAGVSLDADRDGVLDVTDPDNDNDGNTDALEKARGTDVLDSLS